MRDRVRSLAVVSVLALALVASIAVIAANLREARALNPTLRASETWTEADLRCLFYAPTLYWQKRHHGCRHESLTRTDCESSCAHRGAHMSIDPAAHMSIDDRACLPEFPMLT